MATPKGTVWPIDPHTAAKHSILEKYLEAWFPILNKYNPRIIFLDGFCGPGIYSKGEAGSPMIALRVASNHPSGLTGEIVFFFIDAQLDRLENLKSEIAKIELPKHFRIHFEHGEFHIVFGGVLDRLEEKKQNIAPTFALIDPFGFSGLPFSLIARLLHYRKCEVFITFMVEAINRFIESPNTESRRHMIELFGSEEVLKIVSGGGDRITNLRIFYQKQLASRARFVRFFEMCDSDGRTIYYLFFASNNELGHLRMKEAMWKVDSEGFFRFSDKTDPRQEVLFQENQAPKLFGILNGRFAGRKVTVFDLRKTVHDETAFIDRHLTESLRYAESEGLVGVDQLKLGGKKRRAGTFPDEAFITFK